MGSLKSPCTTTYRLLIETIALNCLVFEKIAFLHFGAKIQDGRSVILDFRGPIIGSLKSPCTTSYSLSIDTIALNCLVFWENCVFSHFGDSQTDTDKQMDIINAWSRCGLTRWRWCAVVFDWVVFDSVVPCEHFCAFYAGCVYAAAHCFSGRSSTVYTQMLEKTNPFTKQIKPIILLLGVVTDMQYRNDKWMRNVVAVYESIYTCISAHSKYKKRGVCV